MVTPTSLLFKGLVTEHRTVKWSVGLTHCFYPCLILSSLIHINFALFPFKAKNHKVSASERPIKGYQKLTWDDQSRFKVTVVVIVY